MDLLAFKRYIAVTYMTRQRAKRVVHQPGRPLPAIKALPSDVRKDGKDHYQVAMPVNKRCALCKKGTKRGCSKCAVGLHDKCFIQFHTTL